MRYAIIENNVIVNIILADSLEIAQDVTNNKFDIVNLEELQNANVVIDNNDNSNIISITPNISIGWFLDISTNTWCAPKPIGDYVWQAINQNWFIWVDELQMWLSEYEFNGYNNNTWTPITDTGDTTETI